MASKARELANLGNAYTDGALSNRNLIINSQMAVAQRGTSTSTINSYLVDRWRSYGGALTHTMSQRDVLSSLETSKYALRLQRNSGATETNNTGFAQGIESANCYGLAGTTVTLSFKARKGADLSGQFNSRIFFGTGVDQNPVSMTGQTSSAAAQTLSTDWTYYTQTVTVPSGTTQMTVGFDWTPTGTAGTNDWFEVSEVQLERGDTATPFEHRSYGQELALCQRYYWRTSPVGASWVQLGAGVVFTATDAYAIVRLPCDMRASPSCSYSGTTGDVQTVAGGVSLTSTTATVISEPSPQAFRIDTVFTGGTTGHGCWVRVQNVGTNYFDADAEL